MVDKNTKEVSVIIAAHNEEKYVKKCVLTIANQAFPPFEIIVVDDGSIDGTWPILKSLKKQFKTNIQLKIYKKKHIGQSNARNYGVKKSKGHILVFPDADMYFDFRYIEKLVKPIIKGQSIATFTKGEYVGNNKNVWSRCWNINTYLPIDKRIPDGTPDRINNIRAIRRAEFLKVKGFSDVGFNNDVTVLDKLGLPNGSLAASGAICYHYNPETLLKVFFSARYRGRNKFLRSNIKNLLIFSLPNSIRKGIIDGLKYKTPQYLVFKIVFDIGVFIGLIEKLILTKPPKWE